MSLNTLLIASRLIAVQAPPPPVYEAPFNIDDALISARGSNVFTGNWESQTFAENSGSIINVNTAQPVIIENSRFRSRSQHACVRSLIPGSQITVRNCIGETLNPNVAGQAAGYFVKLSEPGTVVVENNTISGSGGVLIVGVQNVRKIAISTPKSPIRLRIIAFRAALEFFHPTPLGRSNQKPISRNEHKPTPSQPTNIIRKLLPVTRMSMKTKNKFR